MFNSFFINTRTSLDRIRRQLSILSHSVSFLTQAFFIAYYVYLICANTNHPVYLTIYISLLSITVFLLFIEIFYLARRGRTRLEKRRNIEDRRRFLLASKCIKTALKLAVIIISGIEMYQNGGGNQFQLIAYTLTIMMFIVNIIINILIEIINRDIDMIRLSINMDIERSRILSAIFKSKEYTDQELRIMEGIQNKSGDTREKQPGLIDRITNLFK